MNQLIHPKTRQCYADTPRWVNRAAKLVYQSDFLFFFSPAAVFKSQRRRFRSRCPWIPRTPMAVCSSTPASGKKNPSSKSFYFCECATYVQTAAASRTFREFAMGPRLLFVVIVYTYSSFENFSMAFHLAIENEFFIYFSRRVKAIASLYAIVHSCDIVCTHHTDTYTHNRIVSAKISSAALSALTSRLRLLIRPLFLLLLRQPCSIYTWLFVVDNLLQ